MKCLYKWGLLALMLIMVLSILVVGCGQKNVVANINHRAITRDEYVDRLERTQVPSQNGQQQELGALILDRMIEEELILELAEKQGVKPTDKQIDERIAETKKKSKNLAAQLKLQDISDAQFRQMIAVNQAIFNLQTKGVKLDNKDVRDYYDKNKDSFTEPEQWTVESMATKDKADADKAIDMLGKGIPFDTVMHQLQPRGVQAPSSKVITRDTAKNAPGAAEIFKTPVNKWTNPVALKNGAYAIFLVAAHQPARTPPYDEVSFGIRESLMTRKGQERKNDVEGDLAKFRKSSKIDVDINRYKQMLLQREAADQGQP